MYKDLIDGSTRVIFIFNIISKRALRDVIVITTKI